MAEFKDKSLDCTRFEELLSDYLEKSLDDRLHLAAAEHAIACPLCHSLMNDVRDSLAACQSSPAPATSMTRIEARIISMTTPETAMSCEEFENALTDYLDGFLPAAIFHRWERHLALCADCEDTPAMVVRSIASCYTYKLDELAVPAGLHERILLATLGTETATDVNPSLIDRAGRWFSGFRLPFALPQLAPVAMMLMLAFFIFSQTASADGTISGVYFKGLELAEQSYNQGASAFRNGQANQPNSGEPVSGATYVDNGDGK